MSNIREIRVFVPAVNASGQADSFVFEAKVTQEEHALGVHYDQAINAAKSAGFEPMGAADEDEPLGRLFAEALAIREADEPRLMVWCGEGGVETVVSDRPMRYLVVNTDVSDLEHDIDVISITLTPTIGCTVEHHRTTCFSGMCDVNADEIKTVWDQVASAPSMAF